MRRRPKASPVSAVPPQLREVAVVEDWVRSTEIAEHTFRPACPVCCPVGTSVTPAAKREACSLSVGVLARRRQQDALHSWLDDHGLEARHQSLVSGRPRWRNHPVERV